MSSPSENLAVSELRRSQAEWLRQPLPVFRRLRHSRRSLFPRTVQFDGLQPPTSYAGKPRFHRGFFGPVGSCLVCVGHINLAQAAIFCGLGAYAVGLSAPSVIILVTGYVSPAGCVIALLPAGLPSACDAGGFGGHYLHGDESRSSYRHARHDHTSIWLTHGSRWCVAASAVPICFVLAVLSCRLRRRAGAGRFAGSGNLLRPRLFPFYAGVCRRT